MHYLINYTFDCSRHKYGSKEAIQRPYLANLTIVEDELICVSLIRNHYIIHHTKMRVILLNNQIMV